MDISGVGGMLSTAHDMAQEAAQHGNCPLSVSLLKDVRKITEAASIITRRVILEMEADIRKKSGTA